MVATVSLSLPNIPICKSNEISRELPPHPQIPKPSNQENPHVKTPLSSETKTQRRHFLTISTGLAAAALTGTGSFAVSSKAAAVGELPLPPAETTSSKLSYSRFLQFLDEGVVKKVDLVENGLAAIAEIYNPSLEKIQRVKVQLPGLPPELVRKFKEKNVDFAASPPQINMGALLLDFLSNFGFPLILIGSLLFRISRPNLRGGGPNLPFGLGR